MGLEDVGLGVVKAILPPRNTNDEYEQNRWRWMVFAALILIISGSVLHIALACGWLPSVYPGFAQVSSVTAIQTRVDLIAAQSLETAIRNRVADRCKAADPAFKQELTEDIDKLNREYFTIQRFFYREPKCQSLL